MAVFPSSRPTQRIFASTCRSRLPGGTRHTKRPKVPSGRWDLLKATMPFFAFIWRNLLRRPVRSGLTIVGLSVAVAAVVALVGISDGFSRQYQELYDHRGVDLVVQKVGSSAELNNS